MADGKSADGQSVEQTTSPEDAAESPSTEERLPPELEPSRYIERVSLVSGEVLDDPIEPRHLLVENHRDYHLADVQARRFMSRLMDATRDEEKVRERMKEVREKGKRASERIAKVLGKDPQKVSKALFGLKQKEYYFRYKKYPATEERIAAYIERKKTEAREKFDAAQEQGLGIRFLLTGGTGFVGQEILWQAAHDDDFKEVVVLIRPKQIRDRKSGEVIQTLSPAERGETLLDLLWLRRPDQRAKFRFVAGDVEQPRLGISDEDYATLRSGITHVIHCAASVAFDDPYEKSFRANVTGTLNALEFSYGLQKDEASPFVAHLGIETSYIHGRQVQDLAREDEVVFPKNFYNNYYELTKAMASIETENFMLREGLRVTQLCPAIVIGESRAGNNRGDTKVVNAPVNVFGRAHEALSAKKGNWRDRSKASMLARMACVFPGDPSAQINLIPVDWVSQGILAALKRPEAVGERVHLATDNRLKSEDMLRTVEEEVGVKVRLADPTTHRNVTLPVLTKVLSKLGQDRLGHALNKLGTIFGGYSEWGQPIHEVGKDVRVLGMPENRPNTLHAFRMLCRHNRFVQEFGKVRDAAEVSRREEIWWNFILDLEQQTATTAGAMEAGEFQRRLERYLDLETFSPRQA